MESYSGNGRPGDGHEPSAGHGRRQHADRPRHRNRARHAMREFLTIPSIIVGICLGLAAVTIMLDKLAPGWVTAIGTVVPQSSPLLQVLTGGLLTAVSIIFFVLLMALQQQSSAFTPAVLDQFLRRRTNQVSFGTFVGLLLFCVLPLGLVAPEKLILSNLVALVLSAVTFALLLAFAYTVVDQLRPSSSLWVTQQLALRAYARQQKLLARCQSAPQLVGAPETRVFSGRAGYVVDIDGELLADALARMGTPVEIQFRIEMGEHLVPGTRIADLRGGEHDDRERVADAVLDALELSRTRDIESDAAHGMHELGNIAWSAASASQDPESALVAVRSLNTLVISWEMAQTPAEAYGGALPIVYTDRTVEKTLDTLIGLIAAASTSRQHVTCSRVLISVAELLPRLSREHQEVAVERLARVLPMSLQQVFTVEMDQAFDALCESLNDEGYSQDAQRVGQLKQQLAEKHTLAWP